MAILMYGTDGRTDISVDCFSVQVGINYGRQTDGGHEPADGGDA